MEPIVMLTKEKLLKLAEWLVTGMLLIYGYQYLKQIVAYVLIELHKIFVQQQPMRF